MFFHCLYLKPFVQIHTFLFWHFWRPEVIQLFCNEQKAKSEKIQTQFCVAETIILRLLIIWPHECIKHGVLLHVILLLSSVSRKVEIARVSVMKGLKRYPWVEPPDRLVKDSVVKLTTKKQKTAYLFSPKSASGLPLRRSLYTNLVYYLDQARRIKHIMLWSYTTGNVRSSIFGASPVLKVRKSCSLLHHLWKFCFLAFEPWLKECQSTTLVLSEIS